jgi:hypothetical protein
MVQRVTGKSKLTPQVRQRLAVVAAELRGMVYGEAGCPAWGTLFAEIEDDAKEVGHEIIRLVMQQSADQQAEDFPAAALTTEAGEPAQLVGRQERRLETESGPVSWQEPKAYLPKSRKAFFPSDEGLWAEGR